VVVNSEGDDALTKEERLRQALDKGASTGLPPNQTMGWLGEVGPDLRKIDDFEPSLNAGISQENTQQMRWLVILTLYATVFGSPVALWLLWRDPIRSRRAKVVSTVAGLAVYVVAFWAYGVMNP
jgi:hypothetical protein